MTIGAIIAALAALNVGFGLGILYASWPRVRCDDLMALANAVQSETPIYDQTVAALDMSLWELELEPGAS